VRPGTRRRRLGIVPDSTGCPLITDTLAADRFGVFCQVAKAAIRRLVQLKILEERTGRKYGRVFAARKS
jgi:hypothetical protein